MADPSLLALTLVCNNCEDPNRKIAAWCGECFQDALKEDSARTAPVTLCRLCNVGFHTPAKLSLHRRQPFRCNTTRMRTAAELGMSSVSEVSASSLCSLMCSNCEQLLTPAREPQWCVECALLLCKDCSRDLHAPQKKRAHQRFPFAFRFISSAHLTDANGPIQEAPPPSARGVATSSFSASSGGAGATLLANARATMPPLNALASVALARTAAQAKQSNSGAVNAGTIGDVLQMGEPALTGPIDLAQLEFKNTFNDFDLIGAVQIVSIACGLKHAGGITAGGSLFMWGQNSSNELGVDTGDEKEVCEPQIVLIPGNRRVRALACGSEHSVCITHDNAAFSWGSGLMGILGHASDVNRETPTQIDLRWNSAAAPADTNERLVGVACGPHNTGIVCAGRADGRQIYTFGAGEYGTLGTGNKVPSLQPQLIHVVDTGASGTNAAARFPPIAHLAFGTNHAIAVAEDGTCYSWGSNQFGALGYTLEGQSGAANDGLASVRGSFSLAGGGGAAAAAAAAAALRRTVATSVSGDLQLRPRIIESLRTQGVKVKRAACGELSTSVLTSDGAVYSWGSGETHQLGILDNVDYFAPVKAAVLGGDSAELKAVSLAVGVSSCAAVTESGDLYMWGWSVEAPTPTIVQHMRSNHLQSVALGAHDNVVCLTGVANEIYEWHFGDDGDQKAEPRPKQNRALRGKRLVSVSVDRARNAAATAAGVLLEWGADTRDPDAPDDVEFDATRPREIRLPWSVREVLCAAEHSVALTADGKCLTWGTGGMGRLGQASDRDYSTPTLVEALKDLVCTSIAIGPHNTGVVTSDRRAYVWGAGNSGQLGNGDIQPLLTPTQIGSLQHVEASSMAFGNRHLVVVARDGSVYTSGDNGMGQCGLGAAAESKYLKPQSVTSLASIPIARVACGDNVTMLLTRDGRLFAFGAGETNQIPGHAEDVHTPVQVAIPGGRAIKEISVASINCAALTDDGTVWVWGWALGEKVTRVDYMVQEGLLVDKIAMGPAYMLLTV